jgi:phosphinothricin acetyltransferase
VAAIRPAVTSDLGQITSIFAHYVASSVATFELVPPGQDDWQRRLDDITARKLPFIVAEDGGGDVLGFAYASPWRPKPAYRHTAEDTVYIHPEHTGRGLGRSLLGTVLTGCASAGVRQVIAVIADGDGNGKASVALHRRFAFADAGTLRGVGYKHHRWLDTTLMQRDLSR